MTVCVNRISVGSSVSIMMESPKFKLVAITTVAVSMKAFYEGQFEAFNRAGFETFAICAEDSEVSNFLPPETKFIPVNFTRLVTPLKDIKLLWQLVGIFRKYNFDIVQYSTPKAALLGAIASFYTRVPIRIYLLWGLYYEGQHGVKRAILKFFEKVICFFSTRILPDSREMISYIQQQGVTKGAKCGMIYNGSACAIDTEEFEPVKWSQSGEQLKSKLGIPKDGIVIGLFCRLTGDKGVNEMMKAFQRISQERPNVYLLVVGREEQKDRLPSGTMDVINNHHRVFRLGWQETLLPCYAALDIFCLPSYREGFPQSLIEAQAMGVAVVTTNIVGARETIVNNQTGLLVEPKNSQTLYAALKKLLDNSQLRKEFAKNGRERVVKMFGRKEFLQAMVTHHLNLLKN